jgi:hypothetical protein
MRETEGINMRTMYVFILIMAALVSASGCDENSTTGGTGNNDPLLVSSVTPASGSVVDSADVLTCNFSWTLNVLEFLPDEYYVRFVFEGHSTGDFNYPDSLIFTDMYDIKNVRGTNSLQFPLLKIWHDPDIEHPLDVRVELIKKITSTEIVLLDHSGIIHYQE